MQHRFIGYGWLGHVDLGCLVAANEQQHDRRAPARGLR
jgi:hypothetical protein